jgi:hypothetical protein
MAAAVMILETISRFCLLASFSLCVSANLTTIGEVHPCIQEKTDERDVDQQMLSKNLHAFVFPVTKKLA